jgi:branched-chain amino acid transport system ATP-binding protein
MLEVRDAHTYYDTSHILQGVTLAVPEQRTVAVLGRNGVGKTTLVRTILGVNPPRAGKIMLRGKDVTGLLPYQITARGVALVPQGRRIFGSLSVRENLELGVYAGRAAKRKAWDLQKIYSLFPVLRTRLNQDGTTLSGGEQQMLACARALLSNPDLLLVDEPSEGLAPLIVCELGEVIAEMRRSGLAILLVEQKLAFAAKYADYVYILNKGRVAYESEPADLLANVRVQEQLLGVASSAGA